MSKFLAVVHVEKICHEYARTHLAHDEPIPPFGSRYPDKLETALAAPQQMVAGAFAYPTLERQAAVLFFELVRLHPFLNGNKRIATVSLMVFLSINDRWLQTDWKELYDIAVTVANSSLKHRDGVLRLLEEFIKNKIVPVG